MPIDRIGITKTLTTQSIPYRLWSRTTDTVPQYFCLIDCDQDYGIYKDLSQDFSEYFWGENELDDVEPGFRPYTGTFIGPESDLKMIDFEFEISVPEDSVMFCNINRTTVDEQFLLDLYDMIENKYGYDYESNFQWNA